MSAADWLVQVWAVRLASLLEDRDLGVLLGLTTLLLGIVSRNYEGGHSIGWHSTGACCVLLLQRILAAQGLARLAGHAGGEFRFLVPSGAPSALLQATSPACRGW